MNPVNSLAIATVVLHGIFPLLIRCRYRFRSRCPALSAISITHCGWSFLRSQSPAEFTWMSIVPSGLYHQTSDTLIACFGYWAFALFLSAGIFWAGKAKIAHQLAWRRKSSEVEYFSYYCNGGECIYSVEASEEADYFFVSVTLGEERYCFVKRIQSLEAMVHLCKIIIKDIDE